MPKKKVVRAPKVESLLIELLTEELPPKSLKRLSDRFAEGVVEGLRKNFYRRRRKGGIVRHATAARSARKRRTGTVRSRHRTQRSVVQPGSMRRKPTPALLDSLVLAV